MEGEQIVPKKASKKAVEVEEKQLRDYELVLIISPEIAEEELAPIIENISKFVTQNGGTNSNVERWGKRKLAYPIKHFTEGSYVRIQFKLKSSSSRELEANLMISEEVLRHLLIRLGS